MKSYTKVYFNHFDLTTADFVGCEVCGARAVDIHHIEARSKRKDLVNEITNLMALCRVCHLEYGDKVEHKKMLQTIHNKKLNS